MKRLRLLLVLMLALLVVGAVAQDLRYNVFTRKLDLVPASASHVSLGSYTETISSPATTWTIAGGTHARGTCALITQVWVAGDAAEPDQVTCNPSSFDVTITFSVALAGDVFISSDPALVAGTMGASSLASTVVGSIINPAGTTITHNLNGTVLLRCYDSTGILIGFDVGHAVSPNQLTVSFVGSPSGFCFAAR